MIKTLESVNTVSEQRQAESALRKSFNKLIRHLADTVDLGDSDPHQIYEDVVIAFKQGTYIPALARWMSISLTKVVSANLPEVQVIIKPKEKSCAGEYFPELKEIIIYYRPEKLEMAFAAAAHEYILHEDLGSYFKHYLATITQIFTHELEHAVQFSRRGLDSGLDRSKRTNKNVARGFTEDNDYFASALEIDAFAADLVHSAMIDVSLRAEAMGVINNYRSGVIPRNAYEMSHLTTIMTEEEAKRVQKHFDKRVMQKMMHYVDFLEPSNDDFAGHRFQDVVPLIAERITDEVYPNYRTGDTTFYNEKLHNYSAFIIRTYFRKTDDYKTYERLADRIGAKLSAMVLKRCAARRNDETKLTA